MVCCVCNNPLVGGAMFIKVLDKCVCADCANTNTLGDIRYELGFDFDSMPEEIVVDSVIVDGVEVPTRVGDDNAEEMTDGEKEKFFNSSEPVFKAD